MSAKGHQNPMDSPKVEVGEIDTSSPFSSVKDAVSKFRKVALSIGDKTPTKKSKDQSAEKVFMTETQFHLADKELNKLKDKLKNAETTKAQALAELEKAKRTYEDLTLKLKAVSESKESAVKATEAANIKLKQLVEANRGNPAESNGGRLHDTETARGQYSIAIMELNQTKQELTKIRQDYDAALQAKVAAFKRVEEAEHATKVNAEKASDLSKEISTVQESVGLVKDASLPALEEQAKLFAEKDVQMLWYKATLEASSKKVLELKKEFDPEITQKLEAQLAETLSKIGSLRKQMEVVKASDLEASKIMASELDDAKELLQKVAEDESSLRSLVYALKAELENVKKGHSELMNKKSETEFIAGDLNVKVQKSKSELEACIEEEAKARGASDEMISSLLQLNAETENARKEAEEMLKKTEELKKETENTRVLLEEYENKLRVAMEESKEAKTAEAKAVDHIKTLSERTSEARASTSESNATIMISKEEFESLSRKVEESDSLAEMKVSAAVAQVEAVKASENEALQKLETYEKEMEELKATTEAALRKADMAEAAKMAVEGELRRWREEEQKNAADAEAQTPVESGKPLRSLSSNPSSPPKKTYPTPKLEKAKTTTGSRKSLMHNFSGMFHKKKHLSEGGTPSYLPEHPTL